MALQNAINKLHKQYKWAHLFTWNIKHAYDTFLRKSLLRPVYFIPFLYILYAVGYL